MLWGIYARPGFEGALAFQQGALAAGQKAELRSVADYRPGQVEHHFDRVAVFGLQWRGADVLRDYRERGIDVYVIDYGYLKRCNAAHDWRTGHWQISVNGLNRPPRLAPSSARWEALGIDVIERGGDPKGYVLLCVQTRGDASHGLNEQELQRWVNDQLRVEWGAPILLRPHPMEPDLTYGAPTCPAETLEQALAGARLVVTGNSNVGHDSLIAGVPALATFPGAAWEHLSGTRLPSRADRISHMRRLAWGQWTWAEMRTGQPQRMLVTMSALHELY